MRPKQKWGRGLCLPYQGPRTHQNPLLHFHPQYHRLCHHLHHYSFPSPRFAPHLHCQTTHILTGKHFIIRISDNS